MIGASKSGQRRRVVGAFGRALRVGRNRNTIGASGGVYRGQGGGTRRAIGRGIRFDGLRLYTNDRESVFKLDRRYGRITRLGIK